MARKNAYEDIPHTAAGSVPLAAIRKHNKERSRRSRAQDEARTSARVISPPFTLAKIGPWWRDPGSRDVKGVDDGDGKAPAKKASKASTRDIVRGIISDGSDYAPIPSLRCPCGEIACGKAVSALGGWKAVIYCPAGHVKVETPVAEGRRTSGSKGMTIVRYDSDAVERFPVDDAWIQSEWRKACRAAGRVADTERTVSTYIRDHKDSKYDMVPLPMLQPCACGAVPEGDIFSGYGGAWAVTIHCPRGHWKFSTPYCADGLKDIPVTDAWIRMQENAAIEWYKRT